MKNDNIINDYIKEEKLKKTFSKVFDESTIMAVHRVAKKKYFNLLEFVISTGKEAHVFRAVDSGGNFKAVKIYKTKTSDFKNMEKYIKGDQRFKKKRNTKREIVFTWAKKEFKNLTLAKSAGASVPLPIYVFENVLVMEFIGDNIASKTLKDTKKIKNIKNFYDQTVDFIAKCFFKKELIHADLSEYNILIKNEKLFVIDFGQGVLSNHPFAKEFFERDIRNLCTYFSKHGLQISFEEMKADIKLKKSIYKKQK